MHAEPFAIIDLLLTVLQAAVLDVRFMILGYQQGLHDSVCRMVGIRVL